MSQKVAVFRREHFNAAHRLFNPAWDDATDEKTGYVMDLKELSDLVKREIHSRFDHKNLNLDTEQFKELNPTAENIVVVIYDLLRPHIDPKMELQIRLFETPRNFVEYPA
jgi:6-pyruvoyltetrahydropterin/6-carboxytetrahydropterin synthase